MDAAVDRILMSRSGKDVHRGFSRPIFGGKNGRFSTSQAVFGLMPIAVKMVEAGGVETISALNQTFAFARNTMPSNA